MYSYQKNPHAIWNVVGEGPAIATVWRRKKQGAFVLLICICLLLLVSRQAAMPEGAVYASIGLALFFFRRARYVFRFFCILSRLSLFRPC